VARGWGPLAPHMKRLVELLLAGLGSALLAATGEPQKECPCDAPGQTLQAEGVHLSKLIVHQDHKSSGGLTLQDVITRFGGQALTEEQREKVPTASVAQTSLLCLDDRIDEAVLATPGGDLGEFTLGLASYLQEKDGEGSHPTQEMVESLLEKYLDTIPATRPVTLCTDERAVRHLEAELPAENLDLAAPATQLKTGLLEKLAEVNNQGDSHFRLMLKNPEWFELPEALTPMVLKAFYSLLWKQNQDGSSRLHSSPKLALKVLVGDSNPQAFLEVSCSGLCKENASAPMVKPREGYSVLVSQLDAASFRRQELATFFAKVSRSTPRKLSQKALHARMDRHSWQALETTGSRIAANLPFFTMTYA